VDKTLLTTINPNEAILCLNYDGLYGINNMNRFLQQNNTNPPIYWGIQCYKVNDPILFLESDRFSPLIYNNMKGRIVGINILDTGKLDERIVFDIELEKKIDEDKVRLTDLEVLPNSTEENTVIRFEVDKIKSTDEDDDSSTSRTIVPFQLAYAVSIHKAQGLEYDSVKIVITDEVDELITHNIFYTAITRARKELRIYWTPEVEAKVISRIKPRDMTEDIEMLKKYLSDLAEN
jgi:ATP-dependent exoDNAse (exonuclease V) alpha subunit